MPELTKDDLLQAIKEVLQKDGQLGKFKAELRSSIMTILNKNSEVKNIPEVPEETKLINELVREYLIWNGYTYSEQMLKAESGQNAENMTRDVLTTKLGVLDDSRTAKIPLLYYVVSSFKNDDLTNNKES